GEAIEGSSPPLACKVPSAYGADGTVVVRALGGGDARTVPPVGENRGVGQGIRELGRVHSRPRTASVTGLLSPLRVMLSSCVEADPAGILVRGCEGQESTTPAGEPMQHTESSFLGGYGTRIVYDLWSPGETPAGVLILSHGLGEHARR